MDAETWGDLLPDDDDAMYASASSAASWLNPIYTSMDPITISSTTLTISAAAPTAAQTTTTSSTKSAVSATSCGLATTASSTYCTCDGGFGVALSTKTNAAHSTFLICAADPALTVSTITPKTTSTSTTSKKPTTTTTTAATSESTGFIIAFVQCSSSICPIGQTCDSNGSWDFMAVQELGSGDNDELVQIKGTYNNGGMKSGSKATFCGQTSTFTTSGKLVEGASGDGDYSCAVSDATRITVYDTDTQITCTEDIQWNCLTDICL